MSNQQFAEPEWQSPQQRNVNTDPREQQSYSVDPREKIQQRPRRRRPWLWLIVALVLVALIGTAVDASFSTFGGTTTETHTYSVSLNSLPHLVINDDTGSITIHRGSSSSQVTIQATKHASAFNSAPRVQYNQNGSTFTASVQGGNGFSFGINNVDFDVTIPANADLQIHTDTGAINVNGVSGSMSLTTDTGAIKATQDSLSGQSILKSDTGSVTYSGSIDPNGNYEFSTDTGAVDVTFPGNSSFHVDASTDTGSFNSDFEGVNVQHPDTVGSKASGDVGSSPTARVILKTNTGSIDIHRGIAT